MRRQGGQRVIIEQVSPLSLPSTLSLLNAQSPEKIKQLLEENEYSSH
ncbi:hypothetical protein [Nostoc sp. 'Lobaria pulmonaria (5183) cyanobiont']|nr:hypothetical protein [Nostoc sp. 'Lobaria pulmonaria (5183) cyanobiont']